MALRKEITAKITGLLQKNPQGLSITEVVRLGGVNRNTAGRYLDSLLISGQVEMRHFGMAKIYTLSKRMPVSSVLAISSELVMQLDSSLRIIFINQPFSEMLGLSEKDITGKNIEYTPLFSFFDEHFSRLRSWLQEGLSGREILEDLDLHARGKVFSCRIVPMVFTTGLKGVFVLLEDITERRRNLAQLQESEARLRKSEARLQLALAGSETGMWEVDIPSLKGSVDERGAGILGLRPDEIGPFTLDWNDLSHPGDVPRIAERLAACIEGRTPFFESEHRMRHASGKWIWVSGRGKVTHRHPDGTPSRITGTIHDITKRKEAEEALRESEEKFRTLFNNAADGIMLHGIGADGLPGRFVEVNPAACRRLKYSRKELLSMTPGDIDEPEFARGIAQRAHDLMHEGHTTFEGVHVTKDRRHVPVEVSIHLFEFRGEPMVLSIIRDITDRKKAGEALRESEARYRSLAEASQDLIFVIGRDDRVLYVNRRAAGFLHKPVRAIVGKPRNMFFPSDIAARQQEALERVFSTGLPVRNEGPIRIGEEVRWFDHSLVPVLDADGEVGSVLGVSRDITARMSVQREFLKSEQKYRFIAEHSADIINLQTPECILTYVSPSVTKVLGYREDEVLGKSMLALVHPEDVAGVVKDIGVIREQGLENVTSAFRFRHKDGRYLWFESTTTIIRDESGTIREYLSISRDITGRGPERRRGPAAGPGAKKKKG